MSDFKNKSKTLTGKATLTILSQFLAHGATLISGFCFIPIIVSGLGGELYGAWGMIQQANQYLGLTNFKATSTLKLTLGIRQRSSDIREKRRLVGAAVRQWLIFLPLMTLLGIGMVHFAPSFIKISVADESAIRWAVLIMAVSILFGQLFTLPASVLRAQNMEYKAMGLNSAMILLAGGLNAVGVLAGYGIVVLAGTTLLGMLLVNSVRLVIAKKNLDWFGQEKPTKQEFASFLKLSGLEFMTSLSGMVFTAVDVLLIGFLLGPGVVTVYMMTAALIRFASAPMQQLLSSGNAGIAYLIGAREWKRVEGLRIELHQAAFLFLTILGAVVILLNQSFVGLWVGENYYGGPWLNLGVVLVAFARQFVNLDRIPLDNLLRLGPTLTIQLMCGALAVLLAYVLTPRWGAAAVPLCLALGYGLVLVGLQVLIRRLTPISLLRYFRSTTGCILYSALFVAAAWILSFSPFFQCTSWIELIIKGCLIVILFGTAFFYLGLSAAIRHALCHRTQILIKPVVGLLTPNQKRIR